MNGTILVADDHHDVVETISRILEQQGHSVKKAYDGEECLQKIKQNNIKLVFLDIMMPNINGFEVAEALKHIYNEDIKVVYVTVKSKAEVDMTHADGFIQKPFGIGEIITAVNEHLK